MSDKALNEVLLHEFDISHELLKRVQLSDATGVGQPVLGTDEGSLYYTVAYSDSLKVAVRYGGSSGGCGALPQTVSIRCEGSDLKPIGLSVNDDGLLSLRKKLLDMGFTEPKSSKTGNIWFSFHTDASNYVEARKIIGAFLYGLNYNFKEVLL